MATKQTQIINKCGCEACHSGMDHPEYELHRHINMLLCQLDEKQRRRAVALLAEQAGLKHGGVEQLSKITGISEKTIRKGLHELRAGLEGESGERIRKPGAGRPPRKAVVDHLDNTYQKPG
jgi:hypothetical protein